jgi:hypothetical protein
MLPEELKFQAERIARRNGISFGRFIRISIEKAVRGAEKSGREDAFFADQTVWPGVDVTGAAKFAEPTTVWSPVGSLDRLEEEIAALP